MCIRDRPEAAADADTSTYPCDGEYAREALKRAVSKQVTGSYRMVPPSPLVGGTCTLKRRGSQWFPDERVTGVNRAYLATVDAGVNDMALDVWKKSKGTKLRIQLCTYTYDGTLSPTSTFTSTGRGAHYTFGENELDFHEVANGFRKKKGVAIAIVSPEAWTQEALYTVKLEAL